MHFAAALEHDVVIENSSTSGRAGRGAGLRRPGRGAGYYAPDGGEREICVNPCLECETWGARFGGGFQTRAPANNCLQWLPWYITFICRLGPLAGAANRGRVDA